MIGMDSYLDAYVDRRMKYIVEEWGPFHKNGSRRIHQPACVSRKSVPRLKAFENAAADKLTELERRAGSLKGRA